MVTRELMKFEENESGIWGLNSNLIKVSPIKDTQYCED
jgi:hypothetical protein